MHAPFVNATCFKLLVIKTMTIITPLRDFKRKNYVVLSVLYLNRSETIKRLSVIVRSKLQASNIVTSQVTITVSPFSSKPYGPKS